MSGGWGTPGGGGNSKIGLGETFVAPKSQENARDCLAAADDLGLEALVVRSGRGGFIVPDEVWERVREMRAERSGEEF